MPQLSIRDKRHLLATGQALLMFAAVAPVAPDEEPPAAFAGPRCRCCGMREQPLIDPIDDGGLCPGCRHDVTVLAERYHLPTVEVIALWTAPRVNAHDPAELSAFEVWIRQYETANHEAVMA
jgi:hypothetical protein